MQKILFVSDLDGTLLQPDARLSAETVRLLNQSIASGKLFTIATARTPATVAPILKDVNINIPAIVMTGAAQWIPGTHDFSSVKYMDPDVVRSLVEAYRREKSPIFLFTLEDGVLNIYHIGGKLNDLEQAFVEERLTSSYKRFHLDPDGKEILPDDLSKTVIFYGMQPPAIARRGYEAALKIPGCRPQIYHDLYGPEIALIDDFAPEATKANAVLELAGRLGADRIVAFGDNINDLPMLRVADTAVAVENALPEVKEAADIVIGPNTADSVARFIAEY